MLRGGSSVGFVLLATLALVCCPATAVAAVEEGWSVRINGFAMETDAGVPRAIAPGTTVHVGDGAGAAGAVSCEYRLGELLGIEFGALGGGDTDLGIRVASPQAGSLVFADTLGFGAVFAGLNFHFTPDGQVDFYAGPTLAYMEYGDVTVGVFETGPGLPPFGDVVVRNSVRLSFDTDLAIGANVGLDVPLGAGGWLFNANARFLETKVGGTAFEGSHSYDPVLLGLGFGYRF